MNGLQYSLHRGGPNLKIDYKFEIDNGDWFKGSLEFHAKSDVYSAHLDEFEQRLSSALGVKAKEKDLEPEDVHAFFGMLINVLVEDHDSLGDKLEVLPS